jgi:hypothetical protein
LITLVGFRFLAGIDRLGRAFTSSHNCDLRILYWKVRIGARDCSGNGGGLRPG